jgi:trehalose 6-phosphate phosphatase
MQAADPEELKPEGIALFLDVDGTLLDLAPRPDAVEVPVALISALVSTADRLDGALALISGRRIGDLDRLFAPLRLPAAGVHGAELRLSPDGAEECLTWALPERAWHELVQLLDRFPGTLAENKRASFTVHYRLANLAESELAVALTQLIARFPEQKIELMTGEKVFEIKLAGFSKGEAVERFMARPPFASRLPVFIADDPVVDRTGFEAALALGGMSYSVGAQLSGLTGSFPSPGAVRAWLDRLGTGQLR